MDEEAVGALIQEFLQTEGYKARLEDDHSISSAASGLKFQVLPYARSIQFRCAFTTSPESGIDLRFVNELNKEYRFQKAYLDSDDDIVMECDWLIDVSKDGYKDPLKLALDLWEVSLGSLSERIRVARRAALAEATAGE